MAESSTTHPRYAIAICNAYAIARTCSPRPHGQRDRAGRRLILTFHAVEVKPNIEAFRLQGADHSLYRNLKIPLSDDDATTWTPVVNVYSGSAECSSAALIRKTRATAQREAAGEFSGTQAGQRVGVLFEKDGYESIALAIIDQ